MESPKEIIRISGNSVKWKQNDHEDKELVDIITKSIKYLKTENSVEEEEDN